jgi:alpha-amylase/alpha-mannosidase (GH57 family)
MTPVNLVIFWHMHQPQYRDPTTGEYILPWTRLHALKDYWGMVHMLEEFPRVHATFNIVPSLALQLEEYASGAFRDSWFEAAFAPGDNLCPTMRQEILTRAFQANHQNMIYRWPRFGALYEESRNAGGAALVRFAAREWRDLQVLSQLAWMDEEYLAHDPVVAELSRKGANFTEDDKLALKQRQLHLLAEVLPEYRRAQDRGQVEISTTPFYHPILPLVCDTDIARVSNPWTPLPHPAFAFPEDARAQLERARAYHTGLFGKPPSGLWPSEGSVSDAALDIAIELGFRWFATDEGILGATRKEGFARDSAGIPENAADLYSLWTLERPGGKIHGLFRDHYLSDLVGFVYSRMSADAAAGDLHRRIRTIGEKCTRLPTISLILDGENAWEHFPGNGREFLRRFYLLLQDDPDIHALTASEAVESANGTGDEKLRGASPHETGIANTTTSIFPGSWINANFDIWIGHAEDVRAWELLGDARRLYARKAALPAFLADPPLRGAPGALSPSAAPSPDELARAYESILAAEGSDWCWWYGPENSSANDADFDALFRKHLTGVYLALGEPPPDALLRPIGGVSAAAQAIPPGSFLEITIDGRETSFFEWLGAGTWFPQRRGGAMHGRTWIMGGLHFGFSADALFLRIDPVAEKFSPANDAEFRIVASAGREVRAIIELTDGRVATCRLAGPSDQHSGGNREAAQAPGDSSSKSRESAEAQGRGWPERTSDISAALGSILEIRLARSLFGNEPATHMRLAVSYWQGGLPMDFLPADGPLEITLGESAFAWELAG